jgi:DNA-directed RNA polymerase II subunit RPB2
MDDPVILTKILPKITLGKMPIMLKSSACVLSQKNQTSTSMQLGECSMDCGGYFIIKGSEKTVIGQERTAENRVYCFDGKMTTKWTWVAEIKSVPDWKCISPKQLEVMMSSKTGGIFVSITRIKAPIELFAVFRALGLKTDKEICNYILLDVENEINREMLDRLQASIVDGNRYMTIEEARKHMITYLSYTPLTSDKDKNSKKKNDFLNDILINDLLPHCKEKKEKLYLLGYMVKKVIMVSFGWIPCDDRDSYINKRIETTGSLLNNLFRNYFNKYIKEMQKAVRSFINTGCLHMYNEDDTVYEFEPYRPHKITGTMSVVPTGTRNNYYDVDDSDINENLKVIQAMKDYLDYDSDDEIAMNAILNL